MIVKNFIDRLSEKNTLFVILNEVKNLDFKPFLLDEILRSAQNDILRQPPCRARNR